MDPILASLLIGSAAGVGKDLLVDQPQANRARNLEAAKARFSPWTGQDFKGVATPDMLGAAMQGGSTGLALGQNMKAAGLFDKPVDYGSMEGAEPYAGPPAAAQPPHPVTTPSGYNPWGTQSYGDYVYGQAINPRSY